MNVPVRVLELVATVLVQLPLPLPLPVMMLVTKTATIEMMMGVMAVVLRVVLREAYVSDP